MSLRRTWERDGLVVAKPSGGEASRVRKEQKFYRPICRVTPVDTTTAGRCTPLGLLLESGDELDLDKSKYRRPKRSEAKLRST